MGKLIAQQIQGDATSPVLTLPTSSPTNGQIIQSDASGNLSFTSSLNLPNLTNSGNIVSGGTLSGAGLVAPYIRSTSSSANFTLPTVDGSNGNVLTTNGSGVLSFQNLTVSLYGTSNPTTSTVANYGVVYANTTTYEYFVCVGTRTSGGSTIYQWWGSQGTNVGIPQGQALFGTNVGTGTFSWTCPAGVTSVCVVAVGGGGGGSYGWANSAGSGGGLGWKNNIAVTPGTTYAVVVGAGGSYSGTAGGNSYFNTLSTVAGYGGGNATFGQNTGGPNANSYGGGFTGDGGGAGGNCPNYQGGAGAGGYLGTGGNYNSGAPTTGSGGGAGGAYYSSTYGTAAGGGVGLLGLGADGVPGSSRGTGYGGGGGSGGAAGANGEPNSPGNYAITGGAYGGGGGGPGTSYGGGNGGQGGVRIIWGPGRAFPSTKTADVTPST